MITLSNLSKEVVSKEANILTRNLLAEIEKVKQKFQPQDIKWAEEILDILRFVVGAGEGLGLGMLYTLYILKANWDELPLTFRREYEYQFNVLVVKETPVQPNTLDNYFRAVETFVVKEVKPFGTVEVIKRDRYKNAIVEDGEVIREQVEFDPLKIPISKLTLMRSIVENNQMSPDRWSMLMDSGVSVTEIRNEIYRKEKPDDPDPSLQYKLYGDVIVAQEMGQEAVIGRLDFSEWVENELVTNAIKHLMRCLGIKADEEVIQTIKEHGFLERHNNGSVNEAKEESKG
jgi:hypothetical protein